MRSIAMLAFFILTCISCNSGETDEKTKVNTSEDVNQNTITHDTTGVRVDSLNHW